MKGIPLLVLASTIGLATACGNTADGAKEDTKNAAESTSEAASSVGASMNAAAETADVKMALMADSTVDASDVNVRPPSSVRPIRPPAPPIQPSRLPTHVTE